MNTVNIWGSIECDAWSRDFDYEEYLNLHTERGEVGAPFSRIGYYSLCAVFENEMELH